jgi:hypothetical protein
LCLSATLRTDISRTALFTGACLELREPVESGRGRKSGQAHRCGRRRRRGFLDELFDLVPSIANGATEPNDGELSAVAEPLDSLGMNLEKPRHLITT